ncbi:hypothetical protein [Clostridium folliculivorans]|uniref:Uncharacterized protein n=1 Tax=Clostridium folliculivorans TaxID=2886038 RepID=A0A9W5Y5G8_9CLOT|nr:hypothetical protein [Clostridium folliculivorans]GKU27084.1 hypothetical protein CFOLD11_39110 [Clostridium folliculivorans]GKU31701.1 hypothetical protein CFB3_38080 [Clostridium folliculivorans]
MLANVVIIISIITSFVFILKTHKIKDIRKRDKVYNILSCIAIIYILVIGSVKYYDSISTYNYIIMRIPAGCLLFIYLLRKISYRVFDR